MAIEVRIPTILRTYTGGEKAVDGSGATLVELIDDLESRHPGIKDRLCDGDELRRGIAVFVNSDVAQRGLAQGVPENAEVHFVPAIGGG